MINEVFEIAQIRKILGQGGSSSSDSSLTTGEHIQGLRESLSGALNYMSMVKRVKKLIAASIAADYLDTYNKEFYKLFREKGFARLQEEDLEHAYKLVQEKFGDKSEKRPRDWGAEQFLGFVDGLIDEVDPLKKSMRETAEERARREAAEHKVEVAEKENAWLRALLASKGIALPGGAQTADVAQIAPPISATTVKQPIRRAAPLATLPQQQRTAATTSSSIPPVQKRVRQRDDSMGGSSKAEMVAVAPPSKRKPSTLKFD